MHLIASKEKYAGKVVILRGNGNIEGILYLIYFSFFLLLKKKIYQKFQKKKKYRSKIYRKQFIKIFYQKKIHQKIFIKKIFKKKNYG